MMSEPILFQGNIHSDDRGVLKYINDLDLTPIKRFYSIQNKSMDIIRAWQAHKLESKWFYVVSGSYRIAVVQVDDFDNPSSSIKPIIFELSDNKNQLLYIPGGYANGFQSLSPDSTLMVFSDKLLHESQSDDFRFDVSTWDLK